MPLQNLVAIMLLVASCVPVSLASPAKLPEHLAGLDDHVADAMQTMEVPGLALTIVDESGIVVAKGYGVREVGSSTLVDEETLFEIGSITKTFTATAVGILVERGDVNWTTPIREHIPYFELNDPYVTEAFTLTDALSHRGGFIDSYYYDVNPDMGRIELIRKLKYEKSSMAFRTGFTYHNALFAVAGEFIPILTDVNWATFVQERILDPLGMNSTLVSSNGIEGRNNIAMPHVLTTDGMKLFSRPSDDKDAIPETGAILSNANDMARWCKFQLGDKALEGDAPISSETLAQMRTQYAIGTFDWFGKWGYGNSHAGYGLGWMLFDYRGDEDQHVAHGGSVDGIQSWMVFSPKNKYCITMMSNGDWSGDAAHFAIANWIHDRYLGLDKKDWVSDLLQADRNAMVKEVQQRASKEGKNTDISFSQTITDYAGEYSNASYGDFAVKRQDNKLEIRLGIYKTIAEHWRGETFFLNWAQPGDANAFMTFNVSPRGVVTGLSLNWAGDEIEFPRVPRATK